MKSGISITIWVFWEYWLNQLLPEADASLYPFQVDAESGHVTYEIRHAAVEEGQLGLPQDFEGATFKLTTGAAFKDNNGWLTGAIFEYQLLRDCPVDLIFPCCGQKLL